jgi:hypothetical protein
LFASNFPDREREGKPRPLRFLDGRTGRSF